MKLKTYSEVTIAIVVRDYNDMFGTYADAEDLVWDNVESRTLDGLRSEWWGMRDTTEDAGDFEEWCDEWGYIQFASDPALTCNSLDVEAVLNDLIAKIDEAQARIDRDDIAALIRESYR